MLHSALKVYLDRFLNIPAARPPVAEEGTLDGLAQLLGGPGPWSTRRAARPTASWPAAANRVELLAALGSAMLTEDAGFHWFQIYEATLRQFRAWPDGSDEGRLIVAAFARFLAAHTPTRRENSRVVDIARRLRRGEELFEEADV